ncbi:NAD(+) diphosphatase [Marinimicrobium locisalis]|uniref:NAD(+) diphosphatase n=1 Tax=Marinimicrobium locisalis TaxID=546022 RepID=UPI0032218FBD
MPWDTRCNKVADAHTVHHPLFLMVAGERLLCNGAGELRLLGEAEARERAPRAESDFLGRWRDRPVYAQQLNRPEDLVPPEGDASEQWLELRAQMGQIDDSLFALGGSALQWARWRIDHRYCGRCGAPTQPIPGEPAHVCSRCELRFYPRLSPCMITLITRGDHCLLARHARSRKAFHTALAGFVEIGERVEDTVHREIYEEVGLSVREPRYFGSQPWPFPGQLMLGFHAEYASGEIQVDEDEILEADWWRYDRLPMVPPPETLAGQLIAHFIAHQHNKSS